MSGRRDDDVQPPEGEVFIVAGGGQAESGAGAGAGAGSGAGAGGWRPRSAGNVRRVAMVLGVAAIFVFGVIVGRTSTGIGDADGSSTPSPQTSGALTGQPTTPSGSQTSAALSTQRHTGSATPSVAPTVRALDPAFTVAIELPVPGQPDIQSIALVGDHLVALAPGWLVRFSWGKDGGLYPDRVVDVGLPIGDPKYANWQLLSDGDRLWALAPGPAGRRLYSIDPATLNATGLVQPPLGIVDAVALDGHLYLNTDSGVYDVTPSAGPADPPSVVVRGGHAMAADPSRHQLLLLNHDNGWMIYAYTPPGAEPVASGSLPFDASSVAVAGGQVWIIGTTPGANPQPVLARLDPETLQVIGRIPDEQSAALAPVAQGGNLWIRGGGNDGQLWCVDAHGEAVAQRWAALPGIVAVRDDRAFVAAGNVVGELNLNTCAG